MTIAEQIPVPEVSSVVQSSPEASLGPVWAFVKRSIDIAASMAGLVVASPLLLMIAIAIRLTSRGPILFRQERIGRQMVPFQILKFRTMVPDAPKLGGALTAGRDPRITRIGAVLRRTKLDELPQLWNVLVGDMSLVGPRPEVRKYVELYADDFRELLQVRPGITDLASLKYRHESDILGRADDPEAEYVRRILPDKIRLGKEYLRRSSLWLDLTIIVKTILRMAE